MSLQVLTTATIRRTNDICAHKIIYHTIFMSHSSKSGHGFVDSYPSGARCLCHAVLVQCCIAHRYTPGGSFPIEFWVMCVMHARWNGPSGLFWPVSLHHTRNAPRVIPAKVDTVLEVVIRAVPGAFVRLSLSSVRLLHRYSLGVPFRFNFAWRAWFMPAGMALIHTILYHTIDMYSYHTLQWICKFSITLSTASAHCYVSISCIANYRVGHGYVSIS